MDEREGSEFIDVTDEDGNGDTLEVLDYFFYNGEEYAVIADDGDGEEELDGDGEPLRDVYFMKVTELEGDEIQLDPIEDDLADKLADAMNARFDEDGDGESD